MFPALTPKGCSSVIYTKKKTPQELLHEITEMEEQLAEDQANKLEVQARIFVRGREFRMTDIVQSDNIEDQMEGEEEEGEDEANNNNHNNNNSDLYDLYNTNEDDQDPESDQDMAQSPPEALFFPTAYSPGSI